MPIYEYQCTHCHHQFDALQKISDSPISKCPNCSQETAKRLVSAAAFQLKGTGWYATDFKDKAPAASSPKTASSAKESASKNETAKTSEDKKSTAEPQKTNKQNQGEIN